jgi:hypothetical protein
MYKSESSWLKSGWLNAALWRWSLFNNIQSTNTQDSTLIRNLTLVPSGQETSSQLSPLLSFLLGLLCSLFRSLLRSLPLTHKLEEL